MLLKINHCMAGAKYDYAHHFCSIYFPTVLVLWLLLEADRKRILFFRPNKRK